MAIPVSAELRAKDPHFAAMCDIVAKWEQVAAIQKDTIDMKDRAIAHLEAELATLRAQLSAAKAAA